MYVAAVRRAHVVSGFVGVRYLELALASFQMRKID